MEDDPLHAYSAQIFGAILAWKSVELLDDLLIGGRIVSTVPVDQRMPMVDAEIDIAGPCQHV